MADILPFKRKTAEPIIYAGSSADLRRSYRRVCRILQKKGFLMAKQEKRFEPIGSPSAATDSVAGNVVDAEFGTEGTDPVPFKATKGKSGKKVKGPRTAYYLIIGVSKSKGNTDVVAEASTKGRIVKAWQSIYQLAVREYHQFSVLRVKPVDELGEVLFSHFKG